MQPRSSPRRAALVVEVAIAAGLFLLAFALQLAIIDRSVVYMDEGFVLQTAAEIGRGKVMYRDVIIPAPGPAAFHLLAWIFELTGGPSFGAARCASAIMSSLMPVLLYVLSRAAVSRWPAALAGLAFPAYRIWAFPHWAFFHYATCAAFFATIAYTLLVAARGRRRPVFIIALAGAAGAVAVLSKQDVGGTSAVGLALVTLALAGRGKRGAAIAALAAGALLVVLPVIGFFAAEGALPALVEQAVRVPLRGAAEFDYVKLPDLLPLFRQDPGFRSHIGQYIPGIVHALYWDRISQSALYRDTALLDAVLKLLYYAPFALLGVAALVLAVSASRSAGGPPASDGDRRAAALVLLVLAGAALAALSPPRDWIHLAVLSYPMLPVGGWLLDRSTARLSRRPRRLLLGMATAVVLAALLVTVRLAHDLRRHYDTPVDTPAGTVRLTRDDAKVLRGVLGHIAATTTPADPVDVIPYYPAIQFLARRSAAMRTYIFWPVRPEGDTDARLIDDLEAGRPPTIIYGVSQFGYLGRFRDNFPELFAYLVDHYDIVRTFTSREPWGPVFCALGRKVPAPPPLVELARHLGEATVSVSGRIVTGHERTSLVGETRWPFQRVVYGRPTAGGTTAITFRLTVPSNARLRFGYGLNPDRWVSFTPAAVTFTVEAAVASEATRRLFAATVDAQRHPAERQWREADLDLGEFSGREILLSLHTAADGPAGEDPDLAGWAEPRIVAGGEPR